MSVRVSPLGPLLGRSGSSLGPSWKDLGLPGGGASWTVSAIPWGPLRPSCGDLWGLSGRLGTSGSRPSDNAGILQKQMTQWQDIVKCMILLVEQTILVMHGWLKERHSCTKKYASQGERTFTKVRCKDDVLFNIFENTFTEFFDKFFVQWQCTSNWTQSSLSEILFSSIKWSTTPNLKFVFDVVDDFIAQLVFGAVK